MTRLDGRLPDAVRPTRLTPGATIHAEGSVFIDLGEFIPEAEDEARVVTEGVFYFSGCP